MKQEMLYNYSINACPCECILAFCRLQLYREMYVVVMPFLASHIDTTVLADGTYELVPEPEEGDPEEPKANLASDYQEGKPRT